jgi:hypothetical protein
MRKYSKRADRLELEGDKLLEQAGYSQYTTTAIGRDNRNWANHHDQWSTYNDDCWMANPASIYEYLYSELIGCIAVSGCTALEQDAVLGPYLGRTQVQIAQDYKCTQQNVAHARVMGIIHLNHYLPRSKWHGLAELLRELDTLHSQLSRLPRVDENNR